MRMRRLARLLAGAGVAGAAACIDITVDSGALGSLQFIPLPYPSVDAGDTLRNASDIVEPLQALAYRANGDADPDIPVTFVALDTGIKIDSARRLVKGDTLPTATPSRTVRVIANASGLQSPARTLFVVPKADTLMTGTTSQKDTIAYTIPGSSSDVGGPFTAKVGKRGTPIRVSQGYIVRYTLMRGATVIPANDTSLSFVFEESGRVTTVDTTDAGGLAQRTLRFRIKPGQSLRDSLTVLAEAVRGTRMKTDTIKWTVIVLPK